LEATSPMAEVRRDDEDRLWVGEIRSEYLAIVPLDRRICVANKNRNQRRVLGGRFEFLRQHLVDVRQVHLQTVLRLICPSAHVLELARLLQLLDSRLIDNQISQRRGIFRVLRESASG